MRRTLFGALSLALGTASIAPATAHGAGTALVLIASGDGLPQQKQLALDAVQDGLAARGYTILRATQVSKSTGRETLATCENSGCATPHMKELKADFAVSVLAWRTGRHRRTPKVSVILADPQGHELSADVEVSSGVGWSQAGREALVLVLERSLRTPSSPLQLRAEALGADPTLDRPPEDDAARSLQVEPPHAPRRGLRNPPWNAVLAVGLAAAAIPFTVYSVRSASRHGDEVSAGETAVFGRRAITSSVIAGALLSGAIAAIVAKPIRTKQTKREEHLVHNSPSER